MAQCALLCYGEHCSLGISGWDKQESSDTDIAEKYQQFKQEQVALCLQCTILLCLVWNTQYVGVNFFFITTAGLSLHSKFVCCQLFALNLTY